MPLAFSIPVLGLYCLVKLSPAAYHCVILGQMPNRSYLLFLYPQHRNNEGNFSAGWLWGLDQIMHRKRIAQGLPPRKSSQKQQLLLLLPTVLGKQLPKIQVHYLIGMFSEWFCLLQNDTLLQGRKHAKTILNCMFTSVTRHKIHI